KVIEDCDRFAAVLEHVDGLTLRDAEMAKTQTGVPDLFLKVALGLHHAHSHDLVHGNLKPSEVMIDASGNPRIRFPGIPTIGTPAYVAPEQFPGMTNDIDGRTDIWPFGIMLYEALTHAPPFRPGENYPAKTRSQEPKPPRQYDRCIP